MTLLADKPPRVQTPRKSLYCRVCDGDQVTVDEYVDHIAYAIRRGYNVIQPRTTDEYLAARLEYPDRIRRWPRHAIESCGIVRDAREVEDRLSDDDVDPLPYRMRRRIIVTLRVDAEFRDAFRRLLMMEGV